MQRREKRAEFRSIIRKIRDAGLGQKRVRQIDPLRDEHDAGHDQRGQKAVAHQRPAVLFALSRQFAAAHPDRNGKQDQGNQQRQQQDAVHEPVQVVQTVNRAVRRLHVVVEAFLRFNAGTGAPLHERVIRAGRRNQQRRIRLRQRGHRIRRKVVCRDAVRIDRHPGVVHIQIGLLADQYFLPKPQVARCIQDEPAVVQLRQPAVIQNEPIILVNAHAGIPAEALRRLVKMHAQLVIEQGVRGNRRFRQGHVQLLHLHRRHHQLFHACGKDGAENNQPENQGENAQNSALHLTSPPRERCPPPAPC